MLVTTLQTMRLDSFDLAAQDIASLDVTWLHALSVGVEWPHRAGDWDVLRSLGRGFAAMDEIGRVVSTAMWFPHGGDCATIGMVITSPRLQAQGGGRWLMDRVLEECGERRLILNATRAAYQLYLSLGFVPRAVVHQCQGYVAADAGAARRDADGVEALSPGDLAEAAALDAAAFGADRSPLLRRFAETAEVCGIRRGGRLVGYAMRRPFGRGQVIGPLVADDEEDAVRLVSALLAGMGGRFVRLDTRQPPGALRAFLAASGLALFDTVHTMTRNGALPAVSPGSPGVYALAGHALS